MVHFYQLFLNSNDVILKLYTSLCQKAKCTLFVWSTVCMLSPPDFATLYSLILHLTRLENWTRSYRRRCQRRPIPPVAGKRGPYNHDGVPKITLIWGPRDAHIYGVCKFLWHRFWYGSVYILIQTRADTLCNRTFRQWPDSTCFWFKT